MNQRDDVTENRISPEGGAEGPEAQGQGRPIWQIVLLPLLAVGAIAAGILIGRQLSATPSSATAPEGQASSGDVAGPSAPPVAGAADGAAVSAEAAAIEAGTQDDASIGSGSSAGAMPGVPEDVVIEMPDSIHVLKGQPAPPLKMTRLDTGETVDLAELRGQPVLVNFWATWCAPCLLEMPWIQSVYDENRDEGLVVLAVDAGEKVAPSLIQGTIQRFVTSMGMTFPVLYGDNTYDVQDAWTVVGLPITFLVDAEGTVVDVHSGAYPNRVTLADQVSTLLLDGDGD